MLLAGMSGFGTLALEVLYLRLFSLVFHNSTYTFGVVLAVFLIALALGAWLASGLLRHYSPGSQIAVAAWLDVHHVHVWQLDEDERSLEAHVVISQIDMDKMPETKRRLKEELREAFGIHHSTLEFEFDGEHDNEITTDPSSPAIEILYR
jgi:hypothetical protein